MPGVPVPRPGIKLSPPALEVHSLSHWTTRKFSRLTFVHLFSIRDELRVHSFLSVSITQSVLSFPLNLDHPLLNVTLLLITLMTVSMMESKTVCYSIFSIFVFT